MFKEQRFELRTILVRDHYALNCEFTVTEFMDALEFFTKDADDSHEISIACNGSNGLIFYENRQETEAEFDERKAEEKAYAFRVQEVADKSWARQKMRVKQAQIRRAKKIAKRQEGTL